MTTHRFRPRRIGLAATAALGFTLATATPAFAGPEAAAPAAATSVANATLTVMGTSASDRLALRLAAGDPNTLQVDFGDDGSADASFDRRTFSTINVFLLAGDDQFRVDQTNGAFADETLTVDGGSGDDTMLGGDGNEVFIGGSGRDFVDGNRGHDTALLGSGEDTFKWDPGDGSDDVDGGSGMDTMVFNGANLAEKMSLFADGSTAVFLRDIGGIRMNMDGVEQLDVHALGGADAVTIADTTGTDLRKVNLDLASSVGDPDGQTDTVTVTGTDHADHLAVQAQGDAIDVHGFHPAVQITGNDPTDELHVNTGDGNDHVEVDDAVAARITLNADLGAGQH
jgi:hypothetical protein